MRAYHASFYSRIAIIMNIFFEEIPNNNSKLFYKEIMEVLNTI